jgi:sugar O-acyltransferase (sialic acid O-acetyltransferase NeuD family)
MKDIILIGGGGHCKSVIDVIEQEGRFKIAGIVDKPDLLGSNVLGYPVIGDDSDLASLANKYQHALIAVGQIKSPSLRIKLFNSAIEAGFILPSIISPRAYVSKHAMVGNGTIIMHDALINANANIGENCIINSKALIEHDAIIENHCHISTGSIINGGTIVRNNTFFGSNSVAKEDIIVKKQSVIGGGVAVLK